MCLRLLTTIAIAGFFFSSHAQSGTATATINSHSSSASNDLFDDEKIFEFTLRGNIHDLLNDRTGVPKDFPLSLVFKNEDSSIATIPVNVKTRGHFRRLKENCFYPPLLIQFIKNDSTAHSVFTGKVKLKLVMPCRGDEYIVREWLVYKIYNLVTPESFRARLVRVSLDDERNKKTTAPFFGILLEEEHQMAKRNHTVTITRKIEPEKAVPASYLKMTFFEYLVGNTDWSVQYLQNIKLIGADSLAAPTTVPYDFDHAGIVNTPYALPAEELQMLSVRQRRYRGYCVPDMNLYDSTIAFYNNLKKDIYALYTTCPLLDEKYVKSTIKYLDDFYSTLNNPKAFQKDFSYPCDKNGTGNVVIKGLKED